MYKKAIFIFRRDLRLFDNTALNYACQMSEIIIPCFIFDPRQIGEGNSYRSERAIKYMIEGIEDLCKQVKDRSGRLYLFHGVPHEVIDHILQEAKAEALFMNADYTPFSRERDNQIFHITKRHNIAFHVYDDTLLNAPDLIKRADGKPFAKFTPFYKKSLQYTVLKPALLDKFENVHFYNKRITNSCGLKSSCHGKLQIDSDDISYISGNREYGLKILKKLPTFKNYAKERDIPYIATTRLSAYLKFGILSIREVYYAIRKELGINHALLRQLYWRDFWTYISFHAPYVYQGPYQRKYENITWNNDKRMFNKWCQGETGFPIVDVGMRELNETGFMHNRVRMIVASFLVKDLHINWQWGEKYFAQKLIDYDPALNNGNWQWIASTGCDSQPYFRIFNPWLQQKKFDKDTLYIKKWIPELNKLSPSIIHSWMTQCLLYKKKIKYTCPIVDHKKESLRAKKYYAHI